MKEEQLYKSIFYSLWGQDVYILLLDHFYPHIVRIVVEYADQKGVKPIYRWTPTFQCKHINQPLDYCYCCREKPVLCFSENTSLSHSSIFIFMVYNGEDFEGLYKFNLTGSTRELIYSDPDKRPHRIYNLSATRFILSPKADFSPRPSFLFDAQGTNRGAINSNFSGSNIVVNQILVTSKSYIVRKENLISFYWHSARSKITNSDAHSQHYFRIDFGYPTNMDGGNDMQDCDIVDMTMGDGTLFVFYTIEDDGSEGMASFSLEDIENTEKRTLLYTQNETYHYSGVPNIKVPISIFACYYLEKNTFLLGRNDGLFRWNIELCKPLRLWSEPVSYIAGVGQLIIVRSRRGFVYFA